MSTPVPPPLFTPAYPARSHQIPILPYSVNVAYRPPVKVEFPQFDSVDNNDPVSFVERCEEYFAIKPLTDSEILASLTSVLKGTAKDWWLAENDMCLPGNKLSKIFCMLSLLMTTKPKQLSVFWKGNKVPENQFVTLLTTIEHFV